MMFTPPWRASFPIVSASGFFHVDSCIKPTINPQSFVSTWPAIAITFRLIRWLENLHAHIDLHPASPTNLK